MEQTIACEQFISVFELEDYIKKTKDGGRFSVGEERNGLFMYIMYNIVAAGRQQCMGVHMRCGEWL